MTVRACRAAIPALTMLLVAALAAVPAPAAAGGDGQKYLNQTKLEEGLDLLAGQIADSLKARKEEEVRIAEVVCTGKKDDPHAAGLEAEATR